MFQYYSIQLKLLILGIAYSILGYILFLMYSSSFDISNALILLFDLVLSLDLLLFPFFFFQAFKKYRMPKDHYNKRKFETPKYFKLLLVPAYQMVLINSFVRYFNPRVYMKGKDRSYLSTYYEETRIAETSHILAFVPTFILQVTYLLQGEYLHFLFLGLFNILFNIYPILLQRQNRFLIERRFPNLLGIN
ncbi:hypothetical protein OAD66_04125 [Bacteroidia bacterium]|nr:hypothetical protein [Bacteroidia bacterium]